MLFKENSSSGVFDSTIKQEEENLNNNTKIKKSVSANKSGVVSQDKARVLPSASQKKLQHLEKNVNKMNSNISSLSVEKNLSKSLRIFLGEEESSISAGKDNSGNNDLFIPGNDINNNNSKIRNKITKSLVKVNSNNNNNNKNEYIQESELKKQALISPINNPGSKQRQESIFDEMFKKK